MKKEGEVSKWNKKTTSRGRDWKRNTIEKWTALEGGQKEMWEQSPNRAR